MYRVVKTIKGIPYLYEQRTYRQGGKVRTESRYIGPVSVFGRDVAAELPAVAEKAVNTTPKKGRLSPRKVAERLDASEKESPYQSIVDKISAELAAGAVPWVKPWAVPMPRNGATGRHYSGINILSLWADGMEKGYTNPRWFTFHQAKELGGNVRKGEKGSRIVLVRDIVTSSENAREEKGGKVNTTPGDDPDEKRVTFLKGYTVFNAEQIDGLPERFYEKQEEGYSGEYAEAHDLVSRVPATILPGLDKAFFSPESDTITMPPMPYFSGPSEYYSTIFHELGHWTGHESRLARPMDDGFRTRGYAQEELIAELTAAFLCGTLGVPGHLRHAGYIGGWIQLLKDDPKALMKAASAASKAADFLLSAVGNARGAWPPAPERIDADNPAKPCKNGIPSARATG